MDNMESSPAQEVLAWAIEKYGDKAMLSSSFGAEDVVLIDMLCKLTPNPSIFTLDTGRLNQETYNVMDAIREKYKIDIKIYFPEKEEVEKMVTEKGLNLFYESVENRKLCCGIRKVQPLRRALKDAKAWITGLRREQNANRQTIEKVHEDETFGVLIKVNPIADWTEKRVWDYIKENNVPYNTLHDKDFPSIGCECCTRSVKPGEDPRSGRWWWENAEDGKKECGLHVGK